MVLLLSATLGADNGDLWQAFIDANKGKDTASLPWGELSVWAGEERVGRDALVAGAALEDKAIQLYSVCLLLERGLEVDAIAGSLKRLESQDEAFWVAHLRHGGAKSLQKLEELMEAEKDESKARVLCSRLVSLRRSEKGRARLLSLVDRDTPEGALLLAESGLIEDARNRLEALADMPTDEGTRARKLLASDEALRQLGGVTERERLEVTALYQEAREVLRELIINHQQFTVNDTGRAILADADGILRREAEARRSLSDMHSQLREGEMMLWEMLSTARRYYVDAPRTEVKRMIEAAARGIAESLDRHCSYMGSEETRRSQEHFNGNYVGVGAVVSKMPTGAVQIERVFFGAPAHLGGIRSLDIIIEVEGRSTLDMPLEDTVAILRGVPGTDVKLKILREGWDKPVDFTLTRKAVNNPSIFFEEMPGDVLCVKLTEFISTSDEDLAREVARRRDELRKQGRDIRGLVFDLRDNGGGLLETAIHICDEFLPAGKLIVYSEGRPGVVNRMEATSTERGSIEDIPLVVLVNGGSASASEVVSGCLRDHKRAVIVGERTFGKGSVQQLLPLNSTMGQSRFRLTIAYYYLPSGECIHAKPGLPGGVMPHVTADIPEESSDVMKELLRIDRQKSFTDYVTRNLADKDLRTQVALTLGPNDHAQFPGFEEWYKALATSVPREIVCRYLRARIRMSVSEDLGRFLIADWQADPQLQAGIKELAKMTSSHIGEVPEYKVLLK